MRIIANAFFDREYLREHSSVRSHQVNAKHAQVGLPIDILVGIPVDIPVDIPIVIPKGNPHTVYVVQLLARHVSM